MAFPHFKLNEIEVRIFSSRSLNGLTMNFFPVYAGFLALMAPSDPSHSHIVSLQTSDTYIQLTAQNSSIRIDSLRSPKSKRNWGSSEGQSIELLREGTIKGQIVELNWKLTKTEHNHHQISFTFASERLGLLAHSTWEVPAKFGPIRHTLSIENRGQVPIELPLQKTLSWSFAKQDHHELTTWSIEKAAGRPSLTGVHTDTIREKFDKTVISEPYVSDQRAYSEDWRDRDMVPWVLVEEPSSRTGWYAGIEFSGRVSLHLQESANGLIGITSGLADEPAGAPDFRTIVRPNTTYSLPTVFVGCFTGTVDDGSNQLKQWVRQAVQPKIKDPRYPLLTLNSWGSGMAIDEKFGEQMLDDAYSLGIEQFHIDAGWFREVGDWRANPSKFPSGMRAMSDKIHSKGLNFGLWYGWTQAGIGPENDAPKEVLSVHSRKRQSWLSQSYSSDWKPSDFVGADVCLANKDAADWCYNLLHEGITEFKIDMLEHDQRMIVSDCIHSDHPHTSSHSDIAYHAALGYYEVYDRIRHDFPNLMFEDCVNGGRVVDYGVLRRVSYISIVDSYFPLANRRAIYDLLYVVPPSLCECYVMEMPVKTIGEFRSMLRSGMMGWFSLMQDPHKWSPEQFKAAQEEIANYKLTLRPLIQHGNVYHVSERPDGIIWDGMEFLSQDRKSGVLYAFRGTTAARQHQFRLKGLEAAWNYQVHFHDGSAKDLTLSGKQLMDEGILVSLGGPETSELLYISKC
jgi:hypothetical protein